MGLMLLTSPPPTAAAAAAAGINNNNDDSPCSSTGGRLDSREARRLVSSDRLLTDEVSHDERSSDCMLRLTYVVHSIVSGSKYSTLFKNTFPGNREINKHLLVD